jgi:hypothetical protein
MTPSEFRTHDTGTLVQAVACKNESISAEITYGKPISSGYLVLILQPHFGEAYSVLRHDDVAATFIHGTKEGVSRYGGRTWFRIGTRLTLQAADALLVQHADTIPTLKTGSLSCIAATITKTTATAVIEGSKQEVCGQNCPGKSYCSADCYCENC